MIDKVVLYTKPLPRLFLPQTKLTRRQRIRVLTRLNRLTRWT